MVGCDVQVGVQDQQLHLHSAVVAGRFGPVSGLGLPPMLLAVVYQERHSLF